MPERIYKLQPNRTIQLRGFDDLGASAAIYGATATEFNVSGTFRDSADFAVLTLYDADNFYEHPRLRYLPDFNFDGLTLTFDVMYTNLMPLDSPRFWTIDWPFLDVTTASNQNVQVRLFDYATTLVDGNYTPATGTFTINANEIKQYDRVTIWYLNYAFDYLVPQIECSLVFAPAGAGTIHSVTVDEEVYATTETGGDTAASIAARIRTAVATSSKVTATVIGGQVDLRNKAVDGKPYEVSSTAAGDPITLNGVSAASIASALAAQIEDREYTDALIGLHATSDGPALTIEAKRPGVDGNAITLYSISKNERLTAQAEVTGSKLVLSGGRSDARWRISLNFTALGIPQIRKMWLTFAPPIAIGAALETVEWQAEFTNWTLTGPEPVRMLQVAAPGSVRVEENDSWCKYSGTWIPEEGFFSMGFARRTAVVGDTVTVRYSCASVHDLYIGTSLYLDRGTAMVRLDGGPETPLNCFLATDSAVNTRRRVRTSVAAGEHVVTIRLATPGFFYFDFLEAAVLGDVPDALPAINWMSPALDYSTDHTYKLPPERILWNMDKLGFTGPMNEYIGVFWWNQRKEVGGFKPSLTVTFGGEFVPGDALFMEIGGLTVGKTVFPDETNANFAAHFVYAINSKFVGVYAALDKDDDKKIVVSSRSANTAYAFTFNAWAEKVEESTGTVTTVGSLQDGVIGTWQVDPSQQTVLNRGASSWHRAMFAGCHARSREITVAMSMELVNPPQGFAACFPNGFPVTTDIGFASLHSTHCAFSSTVLEFQKRVMKEIAGLMVSAGLTPSLQLGEFLWWFFASSSGMAYYDSETKAAALTALGRPLHTFLTPTDNPNVNGGADAQFLRNRLRDHAAGIVAHVKTAYPYAKFELLFPYDVNHPSPAGIHSLGGALNRFVNFPSEWQSKATSGLDRIKMEGLDFGAWTRSLDLCGETMRFPIQLGWPRDSIRYLVPVFRAGSAWEREYLMARGLGIPIVNFWAFDHFCIYGLDPREPQNHGRAVAA